VTVKSKPGLTISQADKAQRLLGNRGKLHDLVDMLTRATYASEAERAAFERIAAAVRRMLDARAEAQTAIVAAQRGYLSGPRPGSVLRDDHVGGGR
jgi:hypothetical protein